MKALNWNFVNVVIKRMANQPEVDVGNLNAVEAIACENRRIFCLLLCEVEGFFGLTKQQAENPSVFAGYANEVGEAFRSHIPRYMYLGSYGVASTYCLADSISKGFHCYKDTPNLPTEIRRRVAAETVIEAGVWQGLASVIIPGFTINRMCAVSRYALQRMARPMPMPAQKWTTTLIGLCMIPVIIKPIDRLVDGIMEKVVDASKELGISHQLDHTKNSHYSHHFK